MTGAAGETRPTAMCLGPDAIERIAAGDHPSDEESAHLPSCERCRQSVESARADLALMASLARVNASPAAPLPERAPARESRLLPPGTRLAEFTITGVLGRGGMGVVYSAEQDAPRRPVALKLVQADLVSAGALRRFEHEAAALALLHHPAIAQVYSAGLAGAVEPGSGSPGQPRPYIAMELVRGKPLEEFAGDAGLGLADRLRLVIAVCDAADHAHRRGVIHRDLKPSNILVREGPDGAPHPTVVDFGVAKLRAAPGEGAMTHDGAFVGTLAFASPEQVGSDAGAVDARTDVYALGVVLYRLVTGRHPYELDSSLADAVSIIAKARIVPPRRVCAEIDGELALIIQTSLAAEPERRYNSAALLGEDLQRYLERRPLRARGDSAAYVLRKAVARHPYRAGAAALALLAGVGVAITVGVLQLRASAAEQAKAKVLDALFASLDRANEEEPDTPRLDSIADFLDETGEQAKELLTDFPEEHALFLHRLGRVNLGHQRLDAAIEQLEHVANYRRQQARIDPAVLAGTLIDLGRAYQKRGDFGAALAIFQEALAVRERTLGPLDLDISLRYYIGTVLNGQKRYPEATTHFRAAVEAQEAVSRDSLDYAKYLNALAASLRGEGKFAEALDVALAALDAIERKEGPDAKGVVFAISNVVANLITLERFAEAEPLLERGLRLREKHYGAEDPRVASALVQMASLKLRMAGLEEGEKVASLLDDAADRAQRALELRRTMHAGDHESIAEALSLIGQAHLEAGRLADAQPPLRQALDMRHRLPQRHDGDLGRSESLLGKCLFLAGSTAEGETLLRSGLDRLRAAYGDEHLRTAEARDRLRHLLAAAGRADDAAALDHPTPE